MKLADFFKLKLGAEHEAALTAAQAQVTTLETERDAANVSLTAANTALTASQAQVTDLTAKLDASKKLVVDTKASVDQLASVKAMEITGQQVVPPVPSEQRKTGEKNFTELCREAKAAKS